MNDKIKRIILPVLLLMLSISVMTGCSGSKASEEAELSDTDISMISGLEELSRQMVTSLDGLDDDETDEFIAQAEDLGETALVNGYTTWKSTKDDLGSLLEIKDIETEKTGDRSYRAVVSAAYEKRDCEITVGISREAQAGQMVVNLDELSFSPEYSVGELMGQAFTNMVVGMGTVFIVLIFIAVIIGLFRYLPNPEAKKAAEKKEDEAIALSSSVEEPIACDSLSEDELTAAIAAAIAAYEAENGKTKAGNGLIVRSIKRVPNVIKKRS